MKSDEGFRFERSNGGKPNRVGGERGAFRLFEYTNVDGFLTDLSLASLQRRPFVADLLFRGAGDVDWGLVPAARRPPWKQASEEEQRRLDFSRLASFAHAADKVGHRLPGRLDAFQAIERCHEAMECGTAFPLELLPLAALAQHHGVATRLLDWSTDRYSAAYFAADAAERRSLVQPSAKLAVWILRSGVVHGAAAHSGVNASAGERWAGERSDLWRVAIPMAGNPHLRAQKGVFLMRRIERSDEPGWWTGAGFAPDDLAQSRLDFVPSDAEPFAAAVMTLPAESGTALKVALSTRFGVDATTVFPTLDGAAAVVNRDSFEATALRQGVPVEIGMDQWRRLASEGYRRGLDVTSIVEALCNLLPAPLEGPPWDPLGWDERTPVVELLDDAVSDHPRTARRSLVPYARREAKDE